MGVPVESVAVGKCYLTEIGQVRRVLEIKEAKDSARRIVGRLDHRKYSQFCPGCRTRSPMRLRSTLSRRYARTQSMNSLEEARAALKKETLRNHWHFVDHLRIATAERFRSSTVVQASSLKNAASASAGGGATTCLTSADPEIDGSRPSATSLAIPRMSSGADELVPPPALSDSFAGQGLQDPPQVPAGQPMGV